MNKRKYAHRVRHHYRHQSRLEILEDRRLLVASADVTLPIEVRTREIAELSITSVNDLDLNDVDLLRVDWGDSKAISIPSTELVFPLTRFHSYYAAPAALTVETIAVMNDGQELSLSSDVVSLVANSPAIVDRFDQGLTAQIFTNLEPGFDFTATPDLTRIDPTIAFDFGPSGPDYRLGTATDPFAVRWSGTFTPEFDTDHTLYAQTSANDQFRVIIDAVTVIDTFASPTAAEQFSVNAFAAGVPVDLIVEYIAESGVSAIEVGVETDQTFKTALPSHQLAPSQSGSDLRSGVLAEEFASSVGIAQLRSTPNFIANTPADGFDLVEFSYIDDTAQENATRLRAMITAPVSGEYTFNLAASETAELWLSQGTDSDNSVLITSVNAATPVEDFQHANAGTSDPIYLIAGQAYYVETLHVHNTATEVGHVSVGWTRPDTPTLPPAVVEGDYLRPVTPSVTLRAEVSQTYEAASLATGNRFVIERNDDLGRDLDVAYTLGGTAENGTDYQTLSGIAVIPKGETFVAIDVDPIDDGVLEGAETTVVRLASDPFYQLNLESDRQVTLTTAGELQDGNQLLPQDFDTFVASSFYSGLPQNQFTAARETDMSLPFATGTTGDNYLRVDVNSFTNPWDVLVGVTIDADDLPDNAQVFGSLWARSATAGSDATVGMRVQENDAPYAGNGSSWQVGNEWTPIVWPFVSDFDASTLDRSFDVRLGYQTQTVDIAGFSLTVFTDPFDETTLPAEFYNYAGRETAASWRSDAANDASAIRNVATDITVLNSDGLPYQGTKITIVPVTAALPIGTAVTPERIFPVTNPATQTPESLRYTAILPEYFDSLVDSGTAQWGPWLNDSQVPTDFANWVADTGLPYTGHAVVWGEMDEFPAPGYLQSSYDDVVANQGAAAGEAWLKNEILNHVATGPADVLAPSRVGSTEPIVTNWDVINHPLLADEIWDIVGDDFMLDVIDATRSVVHPNTTLRINETGVLSEFAGQFADEFFDLLTFLELNAVSGRADYDAIGFQSHVASNALPTIDGVIAELDRYAAFGRNLQVTEFDVDSVWIDRQTQADFTRDFFQVLAANSEVKEAKFWGFWEDEHWRSAESAELFSSNFVPHANGQWLLDNRIDAYAPATFTTDAQGQLRANINASQVLVYIDGVPEPFTVDLNSQPITLQTLQPQFVVNTINDTVDANPGDGIAMDANGMTSLRAAIEEANSRSNIYGVEQITFDIPGAGPHVIAVAAALPTITESVVIDATTEPDYLSTPIIELRAAGDINAGLRVTADAVTVQGLSVTGFGNGLFLDGGGDHAILNNHFGLDTTLSAAGNNIGIRLSDSAGNLIDANVVSGNDSTGIFIQGATATGNVLVNNFVGTDPTGQAAIGNGTIGIVLHGPGNIVGQVDQGNIISGNAGTGLALTNGAQDTIVQANKIGTNVDGDIALANFNFGVLVKTTGNQIGGDYLAGTGNLISGNSRHGLVVSGATATDNTITGNYVGTNATGDTAVANLSYGVFVVGASGNTVGGLDPGSMNLISGNSLSGVVIRSNANANEVIGNRIGTNLDGTAALGNGSVGVAIARGASNNQIISNLVSGNSASGIAIVDVGSENNVLQSNLVGTNLDATVAIGNGPFAVLVQTANNTIGGTISQGNVVAGSARGIVLSSVNATGNSVAGNSVGVDQTGTVNLGMPTGVQIGAGAAGNVIGPENLISYNNTGLRLIGGSGNENTVTQSSFIDNVIIGIDIAGLGPTANDVGDADEHTNRSINYPVISSAVIVGTDLETTFAVPVPTTVATYDLTIEFFAADSFGQGNEYLATQTYTAADFAVGEIQVTFPTGNLIAGDWLTATTTDAAGNTSEFAMAVMVAESVSSPASLLPSPQSPRSPLDVSADGNVSVLDALIVINDLNAAEAEREVWRRSDVNNDGQVTAVDALRILNYINATSENTETRLSSAELADSVFSITEEDEYLDQIGTSLF